MPALVDNFGSIQRLRVTDTFAELTLVRSTVDGQIAATVFLMQDGDGIRRIDSF